MHAILIVDRSERRRTEMHRRVAHAMGRPVLEAAGLDDAALLLDETALALVDVDVDGLGAASVVTGLRRRQPGLAVIVVTGPAADGDVPAALVAGASSVVPRDIPGNELAVIADAAIQGRGLLPARLVRSVLDHDAELLRLAGSRDRAAIESLAVAVETKDLTTSRHLRAVSRMARELAAMVAPELAGDDDFHSGCLLHDVGKIGVPETILTKPGPLNEEEWTVMRAHPETGVRVIEPLGLPGIVRDVVLHHHERWDGKGYPHSLEGENIPLAARIFSVCDALDAMTSNRPYRRALPEADALARVRTEAGRQFDPAVIDVLVRGVGQGAVRPWQRNGTPGPAATLPRS